MVQSPFLAGGNPSAASTELVAGLGRLLPGISDIIPFATGTLGKQSFNTLPVNNNRPALYTLSIRAANSPFLAYASYTFPISPANISKSYVTYTNIFDTAGSPSQNGVQRVADIYGDSPVSYLIEGTTGWQMHASDGWAYTGVDSIIALQQMLSTYAQLNQTQIQNQQPLYTLELYDYFTNDYWQVEPVGPQEFRQTQEKPLLIYYSLRFVGIVDLAKQGTLGQILDEIAQLFTQPSQTVLTKLAGQIGGTLGKYAGITPGAFSLPGVLSL